MDFVAFFERMIQLPITNSAVQSMELSIQSITCSTLNEKFSPPQRCTCPSTRNYASNEILSFSFIISFFFSLCFPSLPQAWWRLPSAENLPVLFSVTCEKCRLTISTAYGLRWWPRRDRWCATDPPRKWPNTSSVGVRTNRSPTLRTPRWQKTSVWR